MPIQKQQIVEQIFSQVPDTDIADHFWLRAPNSEAWLTQVKNFSVSNGMTAMVGYLIELGDRHPRNLLIDRQTGTVIQIDYGDCFGRAARRSYLPEVVPFRLTRMMVRAMGPAGVHGIWRSSFVNMSKILREHQRVLSMVLAVFVQEPLIDPDSIDIGNIEGGGDEYEAGRTEAKRMRMDVRRKLKGTDLIEEKDAPLSVEDQATRLTEMARDPYRLAQMYSGWCCFW
jgi:phosphatidylinositol kinase/protein kinase (PI-3  family)